MPTSLHDAGVTLRFLREVLVPQVEMAGHQVIVHHPRPTNLQPDTNVQKWH